MPILRFVIFFALLLSALWLLLLRCRRNASGWDKLEHRRYAHRGLHNAADGVPENSLAAFRRAIRHGYGAELDVHLLRDGSLAVFHDSALARMTGCAGALEDRTAADLSVLHLAGTPDFLAYRFEDRAKAPLRFCRRVFGARIFYWTVRSRADLEAAEREGAQAIFEGFDPNKK